MPKNARRNATLLIAIIFTPACAPILFAPAPLPTFDVNSLDTVIAETANAAFTQTALVTLPTTDTPTPPVTLASNSINTIVADATIVAPQTFTATPPSFTTTPTSITPSTPNWSRADVNRAAFTDGLAPEYHAALDALSNASLYVIDFVIADDLYHITGNETIYYTNTENVALNKINFRLFPNALGGTMHVGLIYADADALLPKYSLNDSLVTVSLKNDLQPNESVVLRTNFTATIAQNTKINYGMQSFADNTLALAHAYPMIAVYDDKGWNAEIPPHFGDLLYADASFFIVTVDAPNQVILAASGRETKREENENRQKVAYVAGPARDFYLAASPDYQIFTKESNGITLRFYARGDAQSSAERALEIAARAVEIFNRRYAPYPYRELDFISTPTKAGGIEYPGIIAVAGQFMEKDSAYLEVVVAHETAHQWFYNLVGNNQLEAPWLDESLSQFVTLQYFTDAYGQGNNEIFRKDLEAHWAQINRQEIPLGLPVRDYTPTEYGGIIYGRGGFFFEALRDQMSAGNFDAFLRDYVQSNAWNIVTTEKFKAQAESHCLCDLAPLFEQWIYP